MDLVHPTPAHPVLPGKTHIIQPTLTDKIDGAVRVSGPYKGRNGFDNGAQVPFIISELLFHPLLVLDIHQGPIPPDNVSLIVSQGRAASQEPAIFSIGLPKEEFILSRFTRGQGLSPYLHRPVAVFGMDQGDPVPTKGS